MRQKTHSSSVAAAAAAAAGDAPRRTKNTSFQTRSEEFTSCSSWNSNSSCTSSYSSNYFTLFLLQSMSHHPVSGISWHPKLPTTFKIKAPTYDMMTPGFCVVCVCVTVRACVWEQVPHCFFNSGFKPAWVRCDHNRQPASCLNIRVQCWHTHTFDTYSMCCHAWWWVAFFKLLFMGDVRHVSAPSTRVKIDS